MQRSREYIIQFAGLKDGLHEFEFQLEEGFFSSFQDEELLQANAKAKVELEKKPEMLNLDIEVSGTLTTACDRCAKELVLQLANTQNQVFKVSEREHYDNEVIVSISATDHEVDISHYLYECVRLSVPLRKAHKEKDCDPTVLRTLEEISKRKEPKSDPRWDALKAL